MTEQEINIAIAEALGWRLVKDDPNYYPYWVHPNTGRKIGVAANPEPFPSYTTDLNAMHEAEKAVFESSNLWEKYVFELIDSCSASGMTALDGYCCISRAAAAQRAEAFLKTLGLWKD